MKIDELTKQELCDLVEEIVHKNRTSYSVTYTIDSFLLQRWQKKCDELMDKAEQCDISTVRGFDRWRALSKELDRLQSLETVEYYMKLEV